MLARERRNIVKAVRPEETAADEAVETDAYSIPTFCHRHGISVSTFYKYRDQMPPTFAVGTRWLIAAEDAKAWRKQKAKAAKASA